MNFKTSSSHFSQFWIFFSSFVILYLGIIVLLGWYTHNLDLIQVNPTFVPMQYNTALGFCLVGLGLLALNVGANSLAISLGLLTLILGTATLIEYIFGAELMIDQLFMKHYIDVKTSHPGRMAPNTALCFSLSGGIIMFAALFRKNPHVPEFTGIAGVIVLALGSVALCGYLAGIETAYGWGHLTKMAIHTAFGFILVGSGFFAYAWRTEVSLNKGKPKWLPIPIGIVSMTITLALWQAMVTQTDAKQPLSEKIPWIEQSVLFLGTLLSLALVHTSRKILLTSTRQHSANLIYAPIVVLAIGLFISLSLFSVLHHDFQRTVQNKFYAAVQSHVKAIEYGMTPYIESLYSIRAGFNASNYVDGDEFHLLVERLFKRFPGITALAWVPKFSSRELNQFESDLTDKQSANASPITKTIPEQHNSHNLRDWYFPIDYIEPLAENSYLRGYDFSENPIALKTLIKSANTGLPAASARMQLSRMTGREDAIIVSLPVFDLNLPRRTLLQKQEALKGLVVAALEIGPMVQAILQRHTATKGLLLEFQDTEAPSGDQLLYLHKSQNAVQSTQNGHYQTIDTVRFADRKWKLIVKSANPEIYPTWSGRTLQLPITIFILSGILANYLRRASLREIERNEMLAYQTALLNAIPNPIFVKDTNNLFTACNIAYEKAFAIKRADYIGKPCTNMDFYNPATKLAFATADQRVSEENQSVQEEITINYHDEATHEVIYLRRAFDVGDETANGVIGILIDITERKQAELALSKSEQRFALTVAGSGQGIWDYDRLGGEFWYSQRYRELLGYLDAEEFPNIINSWSDSLHPDDKQAALYAFSTHIESDVPYNVKYRLLSKSGEYRWFHARGKSLRDASGRAYRTAGSISDITELKKTQELAELAQQHAEEANKAKSDFLANMSHEIRTPMNAIIGMSYLALQTDLSRKQRNYIDKVHCSAEALLGLINDILDFSKIEAGKMDMEVIDFRFEDVLENLANLLGLKADESGLELLFDISPDMPMALIGDPLRLSQVLINLGNNAIKFTEQGEIVISTRVLKLSDDQVEIQFSVRDTGIGLSEAQQKKLFRSFTQADGSTTRKFGGTGLGLAICKKLSEMMHGDIWVESQAGQGTTFSFTARFGRGVDTRHVAQTEQDKALNVLIVDDNKTSREILQAMLESLKFTATPASDGAQAVTLVEKAVQAGQTYDLILMDWKMPGLDGVETTRRLQQNPNIADPPVIIMVTAYGKDELMEAAKGVKHYGLLTKPTNASVLFDTIMNAFGKKITSHSRRCERQEDYTEAIKKVRGSRVLLVEDNAINQELALELLNNGGIITDLAENGREALEKVQQKEFDGVLMDIQMPEMDGYMASREIRKLEGLQDLPIIAMTANAMPSDIEQSLKAGMNDHISKPINVIEMFSTIAKWIRGKTSGTEAAQADMINQHTISKEDFDLPSCPGVDIDVGLAIAQGNRQLYRRLLMNFSKSQLNFIQTFRMHLKNKDFAAAILAAHTLKGVAGNLGIKEVQSAAQVLEAMCKDNASSKGINTALMAVEKTLMPVLQSLGQLKNREKIPAQENNCADFSSLKPRLQQLSDLLLENDADAVEVLEDIIEMLGDNSQSAKLKMMQNMLEQYDFDAAMKQFENISIEPIN